VVQGPEERPALTLVVLPGIFAVENDEDRGVFPAGSGAIPVAGIDETPGEIVSGSVRRPRRVGESDEIRERVVAEPARDRGVAANPIRTVERLRLLA